MRLATLPFTFLAVLPATALGSGFGDESAPIFFLVVFIISCLLPAGLIGLIGGFILRFTRLKRSSAFALLSVLLLVIVTLLMTAVNSAQSIIPYFLGGLVGLGPSLLVGWSLAGYVRHWLAEKPLTHNTEMRSDFTSEARTKKQVSSHGRYLD